MFNHMVLGEPSQSIAPTISNGSVSYGSSMVVNSIANAPRVMQLAAMFRF